MEESAGPASMDGRIPNTIDQKMNCLLQGCSRRLLDCLGYATISFRSPIGLWYSLLYSHLSQSSLDVSAW